MELFGRNLGTAFQLMDDYLDIYGNPKKFGKQVGGDIIANKKSFPILKALELADDDTASTLRTSLEDSTVSKSQKVVVVTQILDGLGVREITFVEMKRYYEQAQDHLASIGVPDHNKIGIRTFAEQLMVREM